MESKRVAKLIKDYPNYFKDVYTPEEMKEYWDEVVKIVEIAERELREKLLAWNDPQQTLPIEGECILINNLSAALKKAFYVGKREGSDYYLDGGFVVEAGNDPECESAFRVTVTGWRELLPDDVY